MVEKAETVCGSQNILYSYRIDLNNDGSQEIISSEDTVRGNFAVGIRKIIWRASDNCGNSLLGAVYVSISNKRLQPAQPDLYCRINPIFGSARL